MSRIPGHMTISEAEVGPRGHRLAIKFCDRPRGPRGAFHWRTWRSRWYNTGNRHRDCYLAQMELQRRVAEFHAALSRPAQRDLKP